MKQLSESAHAKNGVEEAGEPLGRVETREQIPLAGWCPVFLPQC